MDEDARAFEERLGGFVSAEPFESYAARFAEHVVLKRDDGVVEFRIHRNGGSAILSHAARGAWIQALRAIAADPENEVLIITGTGASWINGVDRASFATPARLLPTDVVYEHLYAATNRLLDTLVFGIDIPTIGVLNGPGLHNEIALLCDLTFAAPDVIVSDQHFKVGVPPGDGIGLTFQSLLGTKRAALALYTSRAISAAEALELGMLNGVGTAPDMLAEAHRIARSMMVVSRTTRRLTHAIVQRPTRRLFTADSGYGLAMEMYGILAGADPAVSNVTVADTTEPSDER